MAKHRVPLHQNPRSFTTVEEGATKGAQVGVDLLGPDGQVLRPDQIINPTTSTDPNANRWTVWKLIREVPANLVKIAALVGKGFLIRRTDGEWALRTFQQGPGIEIANPDGEAGNPTIGLADVPDSGAGTLLAITRDGKGRVTGTKAATITGTAQQIDVANGNAAAGLPTISLSNLSDSGVGAAMVKITRDEKGRVSGTQAATTDDLPPGTINKYFPEAPNDGWPYARQSLAWAPLDGPNSPYVLLRWSILTDQLGNPLTDQQGRPLYANSAQIPYQWLSGVPANLTGVAGLSGQGYAFRSSGGAWSLQTLASLQTLPAMTLAAANALTGVNDFQMVAITDLTGGREPCWYDSTVASGTKWRRFSDRSIAN
ncbi:hypothetical protein PQS91_10650 [Stenotrophomonas geniculata]|uniref:hypothetical protein n=1 Tax=Stenotrophomonas geniculata TaxID=86188 RepID=UPI00234EBB2B|nr:hypothetical protein [Stenotrophomonas geniculata]MDC7800307.1 hypothetical protein [Stenotrophomonas geniculata]